jgi:hypothetical protein
MKNGVFVFWKWNLVCWLGWHKTIDLISWFWKKSLKMELKEKISRPWYWGYLTLFPPLYMTVGSDPTRLLDGVANSMVSLPCHHWLQLYWGGFLWVHWRGADVLPVLLFLFIFIWNKWKGTFPCALMSPSSYSACWRTNNNSFNFFWHMVWWFYQQSSLYRTTQQFY